MCVAVPSFHSKWKIQRMTTRSPFTNTGRTQVDVIDDALDSRARSRAMAASRPTRGASWFSCSEAFGA